MARTLWFLAILLSVAGAAISSDAPSCVAVVSKLSPCVPFIKGRGDEPPARCCAGAKSLYDSSKTKEDHVAICSCIKKALSRIGPYNASSLPILGKKCSIDYDVPPIDQNFNCNTVPLQHVIQVAG